VNAVLRGKSSGSTVTDIVEAHRAEVAARREAAAAELAWVPRVREVVKGLRVDGATGARLLPCPQSIMLRIGCCWVIGCGMGLCVL
jgi:hypothetical protein